MGPQSSSSATKYVQRGWCHFETSVASVAAKRLINLPEDQKAVTPVPAVPEDFAKAIRERHFTSPKADKEMVVKLYEKIWPNISKKDVLNSVYYWGDAEVDQLLVALPKLTCLNKVTLFYSTASKAKLQQLHAELKQRGGEGLEIYNHADGLRTGQL